MIHAHGEVAENTNDVAVNDAILRTRAKDVIRLEDFRSVLPI